MKLSLKVDSGVPEGATASEIKNIFRCCRDGRSQDLSCLLKSFARRGSLISVVNQRDPKVRNEEGNTALHIAAISDNVQIAQILLTFGADPGIKNFKQETPVHVAAKLGNLEVMTFLVENGGLNWMLEDFAKDVRAETSIEVNDDNPRSGSHFLMSRMSSIVDGIRRSTVKGRENDSSVNGRLKHGRQGAASANILQGASESRNSRCIEYLIDQIIKSRRCLIHDEEAEDLDGYNNQAAKSNSSMSGIKLATPSGCFSTNPRHVIFFELGYDLVLSNCSVTGEEGSPSTHSQVNPCHQSGNFSLHQSTYAKILSNAPEAFLYLLDNCVYTRGKMTYIDLFPFFNPEASTSASGTRGSEMNLLRTMVSFKRFDFLAHPVCELFLHLKWRRARWYFRGVIFLHVLFTFLILAYTLFHYGQLGEHCCVSDGWCYDNSTAGMEGENVGMELTCGKLGKSLTILVGALAALVGLALLAKTCQNLESFSPHRWQLWQFRPEDLFPLVTIVLFVVDISAGGGKAFHKVVAAMLSWASCRILVHTIARDPDIAMFVEMMSHIQRSLLKFFVSYVWLFVGWIITFHLILGSDDPDSVFHDLGTATGKTLAMFTGELGFESAFKERTNIFDAKAEGGEEGSEAACNIWVVVFLAMFVVEMAVILMNLVVGLAISNIQDLRENADGLRLVKEVMLHRYMESLLRLLPSLAFYPFNHRDESFSSGCSTLSQLVTKDIFNGNAIYCIDTNAFTSGSFIPVLQLIRKEFTLSKMNPRFAMDPSAILETTTVASISNPPNAGPPCKKVMEVQIPLTVVMKLRTLVKDIEEKKKNTANEQNDLKKLLQELKKDLHEIKDALFNSEPVSKSKGPIRVQLRSTRH